MTAESINPKVAIALVRVALLAAIIVLLGVGASSHQLTRKGSPNVFFSFTRRGLPNGDTSPIADVGCDRLRNSYAAGLALAIVSAVFSGAQLLLAALVGVAYERYLYKKREGYLADYTNSLREPIARRRTVRREAERHWYRSWYRENVGPSAATREVFFKRRAQLTQKERDREDAALLLRRRRETDLIVDRTLAYPPLPFYLERADIYGKAERDQTRKALGGGGGGGAGGNANGGGGGRNNNTNNTNSINNMFSNGNAAMVAAVDRVGNIINTIIDNNEDDDNDHYDDANDRYAYDSGFNGMSSGGGGGGSTIISSRSGGGGGASSSYGGRSNNNSTNNSGSQKKYRRGGDRPPVATAAQFVARYATKLIYIAVALLAIIFSCASWAVTADFYNNQWCEARTPKYEDFRYGAGFICLVVAFCLQIFSVVLYILESSAKRGTELLQLRAIDRVKGVEYDTGNGFGLGTDTTNYILEARGGMALPHSSPAATSANSVMSPPQRHGSSGGAATGGGSSSSAFRGGQLVFFDAAQQSANVGSIADFALHFFDEAPPPAGAHPRLQQPLSSASAASGGPSYARPLAPIVSQVGGGRTYTDSGNNYNYNAPYASGGSSYGSGVGAGGGGLAAVDDEGIYSYSRQPPHEQQVRHPSSVDVGYSHTGESPLTGARGRGGPSFENPSGGGARRNNNNGKGGRGGGAEEMRNVYDYGSSGGDVPDERVRRGVPSSSSPFVAPAAAVHVGVGANVMPYALPLPSSSSRHQSPYAAGVYDSSRSASPPHDYRYGDYPSEIRSPHQQQRQRQYRGGGENHRQQSPFRSPQQHHSTVGHQHSRYQQHAFDQHRQAHHYEVAAVPPPQPPPRHNHHGRNGRGGGAPYGGSDEGSDADGMGSPTFYADIEVGGGFRSPPADNVFPRARGDREGHRQRENGFGGVHSNVQQRHFDPSDAYASGSGSDDVPPRGHHRGASLVQYHLPPTAAGGRDANDYNSNNYLHRDDGRHYTRTQQQQQLMHAHPLPPPHPQQYAQHQRLRAWGAEAADKRRAAVKRSNSTAQPHRGGSEGRTASPHRHDHRAQQQQQTSSYVRGGSPTAGGGHGYSRGGGGSSDSDGSAGSAARYGHYHRQRAEQPHPFALGSSPPHNDVYEQQSQPHTTTFAGHHRYASASSPLHSVSNSFGYAQQQQSYYAAPSRAQQRHQSHQY